VYQQILYERRGPAAVITLNRPEVLNAWTGRMGAEVRHAAFRAAGDPEVVGIVITGSGRGFCSGADLKSLSGAGISELEAIPSELEVQWPEQLEEDFQGQYTYLLALDKPVLAAINGPIAGMAVPIALCCDLRFMAEDAPLLTAFAERGLVAEWGLSWLLARLVGPGRALDLLFSSRRVSGAEAERMGLVNAAMPAEQVLDHAIGYVEDLARRCSPTSLAVMKRQVYTDLTSTLGQAERRAHELMIESFHRPDFKEGVAAFLEKRPPRFARLGHGSSPEVATFD